MLTRLKVKGFKNLVDVDVRFGPFTCIAGANGVGKSNLFDAIRFLAALADETLLEAALSVRAEGGRASDVRGLFYRVDDQPPKPMSFEVEMVVPPSAVDDLGQRGEAKTTLLRYSLSLGLRDASPTAAPSGEIEILREALDYIPKGSALSHLRFDHRPAWRKSAVVGACRSPLISTDTADEGSTRIKLHQDGHDGRTAQHAAAALPRTVLSAATASESPTVLCARREMASWRLLQLEPSALRRPSEFSAPTLLGTDGAHLPATLSYLGRSAGPTTPSLPDEDAVYAQVANRLSQLLGGVGSVRVDRDERRELLTLMLRELNGTELAARALSDGTLRFLALAVLEIDPRGHGVTCLEEPENGIHPERIPAMVRLLQDIAVDPTGPVDPDNPLRQVIVNTHSPGVVGEVPDDSLLMAEAVEALVDGHLTSRAVFACLPDTWRDRTPEPHRAAARGKLLAYLNPMANWTPPEPAPRRGSRKVRERDDLQLLLPWGDAS